MKNSFPEDFIFGTATSAYQIEGAARDEGRQSSIWDDFSHVNAHIQDGGNGDTACDHYHLYETDLDLINKMNLDAYRFSISWPRVISDRSGRVNHKGLDFYNRLVDAMLERNIDPFVTLYHWDLPSYWEKKGGWLNRDTAKAFQEYAYRVTESLGDRVSRWITHNEMWCTAFLGYEEGIFAPGKRDFSQALTAAHHVLLSHGLAAESIRDASERARVGIAPNYLPSYPSDDREESVRAARNYDGYFNRWFLDPLSDRGYPSDMEELYREYLPPVESGDLAVIAAPLDFIGVNYYNANWYIADPAAPPLYVKKQQPDGLWNTLDRDVYAPGLYDTVARLHRDYRFDEIYITENGAAFDDKVVLEGSEKRVHDRGRVRFLEEHFTEAARAVSDGIPLKGYFVWSLMDNFEWAAGYTIRYGLHYTDYKTLERIPKDSALWLREFLDK